MNKADIIITKRALSIIEVMVAIFIFAVGMSGIYMIVSSTIGMNMYNKNYTIAANLAREQIELIRNIRDSNYAKLQRWDLIDPSSTNYNRVLIPSDTGGYYKLENDYLLSGFPVHVSTGSLVVDFKKSLKENKVMHISEYQLCLDSKQRYIYCNGILGVEKTKFYRYIEIQRLDRKTLGSSDKVESAYKIQSEVFWGEKGAHSTSHSTIITDWKRL